MIDGRDYIDEDGWPMIERRLPLVALIQGAALTGRLNQAEWLSRYEMAKLADLKESREAFGLQLTLPSWWHFAPVRSHRLSNKLPQSPTKAFWRYQGDGVSLK